MRGREDKGEPTYVIVAAGRSWLRASFERQYATVAARMSRPGMPLADHFLQKVFQVSTRMPQFDQATWAAFFGNVVGEARESIGYTGPVVSRPLPGNVTEELGRRRAEARKLGTPSAARQAEHFLRGYLDRIGDNPRDMKRMVNAFGLAQQVAALEGRTAPGEQGRIACRTILRLRWPALADHLDGAVTDTKEKLLERLKRVDAKELLNLLADPEVAQLVDGAFALTSAA